MTAFGPPVADRDRAWSALAAEIGLDRAPQVGDRVTVRGERGVVYFVNPDTLGVRTPDALLRFVRGFRGPVVAMHHRFTPDPRRARGLVRLLAAGPRLTP